MGILSGITGDAVLGAVSSMATSAIGSLFGMNEAEKNRKFNAEQAQLQRDWQEKMWNLSNEYNSPLQQMQRFKEAGLNPNLVYGDGAKSLAAQVGSGAAASSSAVGRGVIENPVTTAIGIQSQMEQIKNLREQNELLRQQARKTSNEADSVAWQNNYNLSMEDVKKAIEMKNYDVLNASLDKMRIDMINSTRITDEQVKTMAQGRLMQIKEYDLQAWQIGERLKQYWYDCVSGRIQANAAFKNSCAAMLNATENAKLTDWKIGKYAVDILNTVANKEFTEGKINLLKFDKELKWQDILGKRINNWYKSHGVTTGSELFDNLAPFLAPSVMQSDGIKSTVTTLPY